MNIKKHIVSCDDSIYEAWPDVVLTDEGKLICVFAECNHHVDRTNARIAICESTDRGRSWSKKRYLCEKSDGKIFYNCPRISKLKDGSLAIICDKIYGDENVKAEINLWFSDKSGREWTQYDLPDFCGIVPDRFLELESGRFIIAAQFKSRETGKQEEFLWYSDDRGKTWSDRVTVAKDPGLNVCEISIVELEGGLLVGFLRENSGRGYDVLKVISHDSGETWSEIMPTPLDCGHRPVGLKLPDGRILVTYRYIPTGAQNVFGALLKSSEVTNAERHRQHVRIFPLDYDRNAAPDLGYTGSCQFPDGEIYVVNYIKDDCDNSQIRGYSFYLADIEFPAPGNVAPNILKYFT